MSIDISIDFGTQNIKGAVFNSEIRAYENGDIDKIEDLDLSSDQRNCFVPNITNINEQDIRIGDVDNRTGDTVVDKLKRHIEEENWNIYVEKRQKYMTVDEILVEDFKWIREHTYKQKNQYPDKTILTVPVCFSEMQKARLKKAAETAQLDVADVINEAFAGLFSNFQMFNDKTGSPYNILVFDFGGGTMNISIFNITPNQITDIETLSSKGIKFGGDDITQLIIDKLFTANYQNEINQDIDKIMRFKFLNSDGFTDEDKNPESEAYKIHYQLYFNDVYSKLFNEVNYFKEMVCSKNHMKKTPDIPEVFGSLELDNISSANIELSYSMLEKYLDDCGIREKIFDTLEKLVDDAMLDTSDVDKIMMIGGSSKIIYFQKLLEEFFEAESEERKNELFIDIKDKSKYTAVATGALTYLKFNDIKFNVEDRLAYEIGVFINGKYQCLRTSQMTVGEWSAGRNVIPEKSDDGTLKVKLYQIFERADEPIYMGYFSLAPDIFVPDKAYRIDICAGLNGVVKANFYDPRKKIIESQPLAQLELTLEV